MCVGGERVCVCASGRVCVPTLAVDGWLWWPAAAHAHVHV